MRPNESEKPPGVQASRPATDIIGGKYHDGAERERDHGRGQCATSVRRLRSTSRYKRGDDQQPEQHREGGAMGRGGDRDQREQAEAFARAQSVRRAAAGVEREHAEPGEDVGEQDRGQPGQGGEGRQHRDDAEQQ